MATWTKEQWDELRDAFRNQVTVARIMREKFGRDGRSFPCVVCEDKKASAGIFPKTGKYHCFKCNAEPKPDWDAEDIARICLGLNLVEACYEFGVTTSFFPPKGAKKTSVPKKTTIPSAPKAEDKPAEPEPDYTSYYVELGARGDTTDYFRNRGIKDETWQSREDVFVDLKFKNPKNSKAPIDERVIYAVSPTHMAARSINPGKFPKVMKFGRINAFLNESLLYQSDKPIIVVEGEEDLLSVEQEGGAVIALGSTSNAFKFCQKVKEVKPTQPLVISMDNDQSGRDAAEVMRKELSSIDGVKFCIRNISGEHNDPNEALVADPEAFRKAVADVNAITDADCEEGKDTSKEDYFKDFVYQQLQSFIEDCKAEKPIFKTGIKDLDSLLDGGFLPGLCVFGAPPATGKTSFMGQIGMNFLKEGHSVLFYSYEMTKYALMARDIARLTYEFSGSSRDALFSRSISRMRDTYSDWKPNQRKNFERAMEEYKRITDRKLRYRTPAEGRFTLIDIENDIKRHCDMTGKAPIVFIDYLQLIPALSNNVLNDKQKIDENVEFLFNLWKRYNTLITVISSLNRQGYREPLQYTSFKESGGIEFGGDYVMGLQFEGIEYEPDDTPATRNKRLNNMVRQRQEKRSVDEPTKLELKIVKQRDGVEGIVGLDFRGAFFHFEERPLTPSFDGESSRFSPVPKKSSKVPATKITQEGNGITKMDVIRGGAEADDEEDYEWDA